MAKAEYFKSTYVAIVANWVLRYFDDHGEAPEKSIKEIFDIEADSLEGTDKQLIEELLDSVSREYVVGDGKVDVAYLSEKTRDYFKRRSIEILYDSGRKLVLAGRTEDAVDLLEEYKEVAKKTSGRVSLFDRELAANFDFENTENRLFRFHGRIGNLLGWFERDWFISFTAPEKRGKTWWLLETAFQAAMSGLKVLFISLEMSEHQVRSRLYQRLTAKPLPDEHYDSNMVMVPYWDCYNNQSGICTHANRACRITIRDEHDVLTTDKKLLEKYKTCTYCRDNNIENNISYIQQVLPMHKLRTQNGIITNEIVGKKIEVFQSMFGRNDFQIKTWPRFSADIDDIKAELNDAEFSENFIPDVIIIDYVDILYMGRGERSDIDTLWKRAAGLAGERHALVVTADQSNKPSYNRKSILFSDTSEDKRKNAHLDAKFAINQMRSEKDKSIMRIAGLAHRHRRIPTKEVLVLQCLDLGQPLLGSDWCEMEIGDEKENELET